MLVVTRRINESIHIGNDIVITVLEVRGKRVKIGVEAPREVQIDRAEIYTRKQAERHADQKGIDPSVSSGEARSMVGDVG